MNLMYETFKALRNEDREMKAEEILYFMKRFGYTMKRFKTDNNREALFLVEDCIPEYCPGEMKKGDKVQCFLSDEEGTPYTPCVDLKTGNIFYVGCYVG